jgi:hypothetical protein
VSAAHAGYSGAVGTYARFDRYEKQSANEKSQAMPARAYDTSHANTRFHSDKSGHHAVCSLRLYDSLAAKKHELRGVFLIPVDPTSI